MISNFINNIYHLISNYQKEPTLFPSEKTLTMHIMEAVKSHFLAAYSRGSTQDQKKCIIAGQLHVVERANHGLAHGLRQGVLAKDVFTLLMQYPMTDSSGIANWAQQKANIDPSWIQKIQIAASFQRSGRQSECNRRTNLELYKQYERQDTVNFHRYAQGSSLFANPLERTIFGEAILWSNPGTLNENKLTDLKYLRRIFHAAHTLDLRRISGFNGARIQKDVLDQLFGGSLPMKSDSIIRLLWARSGEYLKATGDRDLVTQRPFQPLFFTQSKKPRALVKAIDSVAQKTFFFLPEIASLPNEAP